MLLSQQKIVAKLGDLLGVFKKQNWQSLHSYAPKSQHYWLGSAREALYQILIHLKKQGKTSIALPAYTCHVVLEAAKRAEIDIEFYDSGVVANIEDIEKVIGNVDLLLVSYNFGIMPKIDKIAKLCQEKNVILIEDCAQALGSRYKNEVAGAFGDHAIYSFGLSKNIGFAGGLIASKEKIDITTSKKYPFPMLLGYISRVKVAPFFFDKSLYPFTRKLLGKELHKDHDSLSYSLPSWAQKIVLNQLHRYDKVLTLRQKNAMYCSKELKGIISFVRPRQDDANLYFTLLVDNQEEFKEELLKEGVEINKMFTFQALHPGVKAHEAEKQVLTFALYRPRKEIEFIVDKIKKVAPKKQEENNVIS